MIAANETVHDIGDDMGTFIVYTCSFMQRSSDQNDVTRDDSNSCLVGIQARGFHIPREFSSPTSVSYRL